MKNRVIRKRESKDAAKIDNLMMKNKNMEKEIETIRNANAKSRQHLENFPSAVDVQVYRLLYCNLVVSTCSVASVYGVVYMVYCVPLFPIV